MTTPEVPAEAVEAGLAAMARWRPAVNWQRDVVIEVCQALEPLLRAQWLAEVDGVLRDDDRFWAWLDARRGLLPNVTEVIDLSTWADYVRDVLGAERETAGEGNG